MPGVLRSPTLDRDLNQNEAVSGRLLLVLGCCVVALGTAPWDEEVAEGDSTCLLCTFKARHLERTGLQGLDTVADDATFMLDAFNDCILMRCVTRDDDCRNWDAYVSTVCSLQCRTPSRCDAREVKQTLHLDPRNPLDSDLVLLDLSTDLVDLYTVQLSE